MDKKLQRELAEFLLLFTREYKQGDFKRVMFFLFIWMIFWFIVVYFFLTSDWEWKLYSIVFWFLSVGIIFFVPAVMLYAAEKKLKEGRNPKKPNELTEEEKIKKAELSEQIDKKYIRSQFISTIMCISIMCFLLFNAIYNIFIKIKLGTELAFNEDYKYLLFGPIIIFLLLYYIHLSKNGKWIIVDGKTIYIPNKKKQNNKK